MRRISSAVLLGIGLALAGCGPVNRGLESVNQPVVSRTDYVFDVSQDGLRAGDQGSEARRLAAWFDALGLGYGDSVALDDPAPYGDPAVHDTVASILARRGLLLSENAPVTTGAVPPGAVRVVVSRSQAQVPDCPNWKRSSQPELAGSTMSNFGCATNSNLAAMIANPQDLIQGRSSDASDARTANKAIKSYRDTAPTGAGGVKQESSKGGN